MTAEFEKQTILIVDDEEGIRKVLRISLMDAGYSVHTADNGENALTVFREKKPAIVLTDIKMPGMSGIDLLDIIKKEEPDTEVIMITGHGDMDLAIKSIKRDATDFITKPIDGDTLEIALKRAKERIEMRCRLKDYTENLEELVKEQSAKLIEVERAVAISKTFDGLSSTVLNLFSDINGALTFFNEMPCLVAIHNPDSKVLAVNQLYQKRLGDRTGENSWDIYSGNTKSRKLCPVGRTLRTGTGIKTRETICYQDNSEVLVNVHTAPIRNTKGEIELILEIAVDISEVERLRQALESSRENYQQLFEAAPCIITAQDHNFQIVAANKRFRDDFSYKPGDYCYQAYRRQNHPCKDCPVKKTFNDGKSHSSETVFKTISGDQYHVMIWTAPIRDNTGKIVQVIEMSTNITQIYELQDHLSSLGLRIGSITHGIKGLLTGLDGGMYLMDSGFSNENKELIAEGWGIVKQKISRIRRMVLDILHFTKERELTLEHVMIHDFLREVVAPVESRMKNKGIRFSLKADPLLGKLEVDAGFIQTALINILDNAIDACLEDTSGRSHAISFIAETRDNQVFFSIKDNGVGMDQNTLENLFTLLFSTKGAKGTGFGLFVAHRIIRQHGGNINVSSKFGNGSEFRISLPRLQPKSPPLLI